MPDTSRSLNSEASSPKWRYLRTVEWMAYRSLARDSKAVAMVFPNSDCCSRNCATQYCIAASADSKLTSFLLGSWTASATGSSAATLSSTTAKSASVPAPEPSRQSLLSVWRCATRRIDWALLLGCSTALGNLVVNSVPCLDDLPSHTFEECCRSSLVICERASQFSALCQRCAGTLEIILPHSHPHICQRGDGAGNLRRCWLHHVHRRRRRFLPHIFHRHLHCHLQCWQIN